MGSTRRDLFNSIGRRTVVCQPAARRAWPAALAVAVAVVLLSAVSVPAQTQGHENRDAAEEQISARAKLLDRYRLLVQLAQMSPSATPELQVLEGRVRQLVKLVELERSGELHPIWVAAAQNGVMSDATELEMPMDSRAVQGVASITGVVMESGSGTPIAFKLVRAYDTGGNQVGFAVTGSNGSYEFGGLTTGTYFVRTQVASHADELYDNIPCLVSCDVTTGSPISVVAGETASGIDFELGTDGGVIAGVMTETVTGDPITDEALMLHDSNGNNTGILALSQSDGSYRFVGLPTGTYFVQSVSSRHTNELFDDVLWGCCDVTVGTPIPVTYGQTTSGIDFVLAPGGAITGVVTDSLTTDPLTIKIVRAYDINGNQEGFDITDGNGSYEFGGLSTGTYFVRTQTGSNADELYDDIPCLLSCDVTTGTSIPVTAGETVSGVDIALGTDGGVISGIVLDAKTGSPIAGGSLMLYDSDGNYTGVQTGSKSDGSYQFVGLPTGTFYVLSIVDGYDNEVFDDVIWECCDVTVGTAIVVDYGVATIGVDFILGDRVFEDGFELGNSSSWDSVVP